MLNWAHSDADDGEDGERRSNRGAGADLVESAGSPVKRHRYQPWGIVSDPPISEPSNHEVGFPTLLSPNLPT